MTDQMNESKLDTKLLQDNQPKTITEKKLLFTDYSIERFSADFIGPKGRKVRAYKSFEGKNAPKGLRLCQFEKTKAKYFILQFWYDGKSHQLTLGEFYNNKFGTKEALDEYNKIYQTHTNDKGIWITRLFGKHI